MRKIESILIILSMIVILSSFVACEKKAPTTSLTLVTTSINIPTVINTGTNSFTVDTRLDFGKTIPVNTIYTKQVIVNINNTGENTITRVKLETSGLDSNWICIGSADVVLKSGEAVPYVITLSSKNPITSGMNLGFTITLTASAYVDVQHTLECYGEIIVDK